MNNRDPCPPIEELRALLDKRLSAAAEQTLATHVEGCARCREALAKLTHDPEMEKWLALLRREVKGMSAPTPADAFLDRLEETPPLFTDPEAEQSDDAAIAFPGPMTSEAPLGQLGAYCIRKKIKAGAFGIVYEAYDAELRRTVALKVLKPELAASLSQRIRFEREVRAAATVKHEHIVTIYEVGRTQGFPLPYFVMEYVEGEPLSQQLGGGKLPSCREAARIVREAALALAAAHAKGVAHRDVKPTNILLERTTGRVKVTDFGLARVIETMNERVSESGRVIGTPAYMSPEQIVAPGRIDGRTDVYSLGVVLYELLTGERPFCGLPHVVLEHIVHDDPPRPRQINTSAPRDLETICVKAMEKDPGRRYQTATEFADDLNRWLHNQPITARPVRAWERAVKLARRRPVVAALLGALLVVVATAFSVVTWKWREATDERDQAQRERDRANRNFTWARAAAEDTIAKLLAHPQFKNPPYTKLHEDLLTSAVAFYEEAVQQESADPLLEADRGRAYWLLASVLAMRGQNDKALAAYRSMEDVFRELRERMPDEPEHRSWLAWSLCCQGNMLRDLRRYDDAELLYDKALTMLEDLAARHPDHASVAVKLGGTYMNRGKLDHRVNQRIAALAWYAKALAVLEPLKASGGDTPHDRMRFLTETYEGQAEAFLRLDQWKESANAFQRLVELQPENPHRWYDCAIAHVGGGDIEGYRTTCRKMLNGFGKTDDPHVAERVLYTCLPVANAVQDASRLLPLAERAVTLGKHNQRLLGAALYRAGRHKDAIASFEEAGKAMPLRGWDLCFLTMACHRAGEQEKAARYHAQAQKWIEATVRADPHGEGKRWGWTERVETKQLRKEMELVLVSAPP